MNEPSNREDSGGDCPQADQPAGDRGDCINSRCLLAQGQCWICHDGQRYRLRVTAANKLILTK